MKELVSEKEMRPEFVLSTCTKNTHKRIYVKCTVELHSIKYMYKIQITLNNINIYLKSLSMD